MLNGRQHERKKIENLKELSQHIFLRCHRFAGRELIGFPVQMDCLPAKANIRGPPPCTYDDECHGW